MANKHNKFDINFINNAKLVIHNAQFDIKFLNYELTLLNLPSIDLAEVIDTLIIAKRAFPGARVNLDALCKRFKVDNTNRQFHGALKDAYLLSEVYVELSGGRQVSFSLREIEENIIIKEEQAIKYTGKGNKIVVIPTNRNMQRIDKNDLIFLSKTENSIRISVFDDLNLFPKRKALQASFVTFLILFLH